RVAWTQPREPGPCRDLPRPARRVPPHLDPVGPAGGRDPPAARRPAVRDEPAVDGAVAPGPGRPVDRLLASRPRRRPARLADPVLRSGYGPRGDHPERQLASALQV